MVAQLARTLAVSLWLIWLWASRCSAQQEPAAFLQSLEPYKPVYLAHSWILDHGGSEAGYRDQEVLIQFSFKKEIVPRLYFAYSQKMFWQVYDEKNSRPLRENDYNPELFLEYPGLWDVDRLRFGIWEHESNGESSRSEANGHTINESRTWNRSYIYAREQMIDGVLALAVKLWAVLDRRDQEYGSFGADNPDIQRYLGWGEAYGYLGEREAGLSLMARRGWRSGTETYRMEGWYGYDRLTGGKGHSFSFFAQAFSGYGDSLIDYNRKIQRFSIGVSFL